MAVKVKIDKERLTKDEYGRLAPDGQQEKWDFLTFPVTQFRSTKCA